MHNIQSPAIDDNAIEAEIQAKGLTAPRITPADVEDAIASTHYFTAGQGTLQNAIFREDDGAQDYPAALDLLTFCVIVLYNGFTVTGESACASPENFDAEVGKKVALAKAKDKIWPLLGFALKDRLHAES